MGEKQVEAKTRQAQSKRVALRPHSHLLRVQPFFVVLYIDPRRS